MRILLTGATGFIGGKLVSFWQMNGHQIVAFSRSAAKTQDRLGNDVTVYEWDPMSGPAPAEALSGVDAVVHLAGENVSGRWTEEKKKAIYDSRVVGTRHLVEGLAQADPRPRALLAASAIGYYGDREDEILHEQSGPGDDFLAEVCVDWEHEAMAARDLNMRVANLRFGIVLHRDGGALEQMLTPFKFGVGGPLGSGRQWWSWVHLNDVVQLIDHVLRSDWNGPVNVTAPSPETQRDFAKILGRVMRRPAFMPAPAFVLRLVLGGFANELLTSKRVIPRRALDGGFEFQFERLEQALRAELE